MPFDHDSPRRRPAKARLPGLVVLALALGLVGHGAAADPASTSRNTASPVTAADDPQAKLRALESGLSRSADDRKTIEAAIERYRTDRQRFNAALIDTSQRVREADGKVAESAARLDTLLGSEEAIKRSLDSRRGVIAEVLASLQRLGHKPPPAILVKPEDVLKTIRTSMMLGAVLPELREEAEALATDLAELSRLRASIASERDANATRLAELNAETDRLHGLIETRQRAQVEAETSLEGEKGRATELARQATTLKDLIGRMESGNTAVRKAAEAARAADDAQRKLAEADADGIRAKVAAGPFRDPARLQPAVAFADTKALLPMPVTGRVAKAYGQSDGFGGTEKGVSIAARPKALVTAPADGWVAFSGPYRTYGQVLILNMGGGYYTVLAGMEQVDVALGQFVLSGEPVGTMGDGSIKAAAAIALGAADPVLYVEFRKDGAAIDPSPWWAKAAMEKVRG